MRYDVAGEHATGFRRRRFLGDGRKALFGTNFQTLDLN